MKRIMVVGAAGQIGSEMVPFLRGIYGNSNVVACDLRDDVQPELKESGPYELLDALEIAKYEDLLKKYKIDTIFNLVAVLSAKGEENPVFAWKINMGALFNSLELARVYKCAVFTPSSIGAFGKSTPPNGTPQDTIMRPTTIYGVSKVAAELLADYYYLKFGVDSRGVRYPGIISNVTLPGGGTTDYAVEIFYKAILEKHFTCNLKPGTFLDMMYMPDALKAVVMLMEADPAKLKHRNCFNITAMSFEPETLAAEIRKHIPEFTMDYEIDPIRQEIADSWPNWMDDSAAREEWGWQPDYDLPSMTEDMINVLSKKLLGV
ncbi:MAG: NAD-dependent epimerase/dehydratase family protein [Candidatus Cloacimonadaceae bacterium]|nr:NAD-dependent epimerase/dehydratase family protein [Candidatus Cloacimonadota bacterium]HQL14852.1 NAD-dependent epimerase/dehydratase family protein [Candidatus Cloacimonadota bacterium]